MKLANTKSSYKIETSSATYYLDRIGAGLSSMIDRDGHDWIGFSSEIDGPAGTYRGFPNAVHRQDDIRCFHPLNTYTKPSETWISSQQLNSIEIGAKCGPWEAAWHFSENFCTFAITRMPQDKKYWILYEGVPFGDSNSQEAWYYLADDDFKHCCSNEDFTRPLLKPQWIAFGHEKSPRVILLVSHDASGSIARYYWMKSMTVFGFGRGETVRDKYLGSPAKHAIGFVESTDWHAVKAKAESFRA
jgi:hypothetical protein